MRSTHSENGYKDMYRTLVFMKRAEDAEYEHKRRGGLLSTKGLLMGGLTGAQVGGAAGLGTGLYEIGRDRRRIMERLENALKHPTLPDPHSVFSDRLPTIDTSLLPDYVSKMPEVVKQKVIGAPETYKNVFVGGRVHPGAEFLYDLKPNELEHLQNTLSVRGLKSMESPVSRVESALQKLKGLKGFGRYAWSRKGIPLLSAMHASGPVMLGGAALGALLGSRSSE